MSPEPQWQAGTERPPLNSKRGLPGLKSLSQQGGTSDLGASLCHNQLLNSNNNPQPFCSVHPRAGLEY
eukprot:4727910-Amphidinium_carterae.1